jgi:hypothetical protein
MTIYTSPLRRRAKRSAELSAPAGQTRVRFKAAHREPRSPLPDFVEFFTNSIMGQGKSSGRSKDSKFDSPLAELQSKAREPIFQMFDLLLQLVLGGIGRIGSESPGPNSQGTAAANGKASWLNVARLAQGRIRLAFQKMQPENLDFLFGSEVQPRSRSHHWPFQRQMRISSTPKSVFPTKAQQRN